MESVTFYMEEFRISNGQKVPVSPNNESMMASEQFYSTIAELPEPEQKHAKNLQRVEDSASNYSEDEEEDQMEIYRSDALMLANVSGAMEIRITMKQATNIQGPKVQLEVQLGAINLFLSPRQLHALVYLSEIFLNESSTRAREKAMAKSTRREDRLSGDSIAGSEHYSQFRSQEYSAMSGGLGMNQGWSSDPSGTISRHSLF